MKKDKKKSIYALIVLSLLSLMCISCDNLYKNDLINDGNKKNSEQKICIEDPQIILGEKIENPFSLKSINASRNATGREVVEANAYYFKAYPSDATKLNYLLNNYPEASTIPLDRDIISGGDPYYGKEDDVKNFKMEYYLAGPLDKYKDISEKMETEILDEMYVKNIEKEFENFVFEGNQENNNSARWIQYVTPKGRITIYDPITKTYIPSGSVRICIYNLSHSVILTTNSDGTFSCPVKFEKGWWGYS